MRKHVSLHSKRPLTPNLTEFPYKEDLLQFIWQQQLIDRSDLRTTDGESLAIIRAGSLHMHDGPDFQNASIRLGKTPFFGSVEIHIRSSDWERHRHHVDPLYNGVLLHVCYTVDRIIKRCDGSVVPTLELNTRIDPHLLSRYQHLMQHQNFISCSKHISNVNTLVLEQAKQRALVDRLAYRSAQFDRLLEQYNHDWNQTLYAALLSAMGKPYNALAMEELAQVLPLKTVLSLRDSLERLEAVFMGCSGYLLEANDPYQSKLRDEFLFLQQRSGLRIISAPIYKRGIRTMGQMLIRLAQLAGMFHRYPDALHRLLWMKHGITFLDKVETSKYWTMHSSFNKPTADRSTKISPRLVEHLTINLVIPFRWFYHERRKEGQNTSTLEQLYLIRCEENRVIRKFRSLGMPCNNAGCSQALLHLYQSMCKTRSCLHCTIGQHLLVAAHGAT